MTRDASDLAHRLAREAEAVCRHYLSNGKREGRYWLVGDVHNTVGRSMFVRLQASTKGPAGKWTDAATGEHSDLLDIIRESRSLRDFSAAAEEARRFLKLPSPEPQPASKPVRSLAPAGSQEAALRLFAISSPIEGTLVEKYLQRRGIARIHHGGSLRFHPRYYYRPDEHSPTEIWPAMIARVTDLEGRITGVHRTWLDPDGFDRIRLGKAPIDTPRRATGDLLDNAVRFGVVDDVLAAGEGIETMLSLRDVLPTLPMAAALSANHLSAMMLPSGLRRLISPGTTMRPEMPDRLPLLIVQEPPALKRSRCRPGWAISTKTCTYSVPRLSELRCGFNSYQRTSSASCIRRRWPQNGPVLRSTLVGRS